jgi:hypothetical protein
MFEQLDQRVRLLALEALPVLWVMHVLKSSDPLCEQLPLCNPTE